MAAAGKVTVPVVAEVTTVDVTPQIPGPGRIVQYTTDQEKTRPAIIVEVNDELCDIVIFNPRGAVFQAAVAFAVEPTPGHISWPART